MICDVILNIALSHREVYGPHIVVIRDTVAGVGVQPLINSVAFERDNIRTVVRWYITRESPRGCSTPSQPESSFFFAVRGHRLSTGLPSAHSRVAYRCSLGVSRLALLVPRSLLVQHHSNWAHVAVGNEAVGRILCNYLRPGRTLSTVNILNNISLGLYDSFTKAF